MRVIAFSLFNFKSNVLAAIQSRAIIVPSPIVKAESIG
jgi:hypothetical protein